MLPTEAPIGKVASVQPRRAAGGALYALLIFVLINVFLNIDRSVLSIVTEPLKREFGVRDGEIGLLYLAFAAFFALGGLPIGRWVDRGNRRTVLAICTGLFSLMTAIAGMTSNFVQLLCTRLLVGAGEAGGHPSMLSMIADLFPRERRATMIALFYIAAPLSLMLTFFVGGRVVAAYGWRGVFLTAGLPGLLLAAVAWLTLRDPPRLVGDRAAARSYGWGESLRFVFSQPALRHLIITTMITSAMTAAVISWAVSFLIRSHHLPVARAGLFMAMTYGLLGAVGVLSGGFLADALSKRDVRWRVWLCALAATIACLALVGFLLAPSISSAALAFSIWSLAYSMLFGPALALVQALSPPRMRGSASGVYYMLSNLAGVGGGPLLVGVVSDLLRPVFHDESLRYSLLVASPLYVWAAAHFLLAGRTLTRDLARVDEIEAVAVT